MTYGNAALPPRFTMATPRKRPVGRPQATEKTTDKRKELTFSEADWKKLNGALGKGQKLGTVLQDLALQWAKGETVPVADLEAYRLSVIAESKNDALALPDVGTLATGTFVEAASGAKTFSISRDTTDFLKAHEGDRWFDVEEQDMEGAGIPEGAKVLLRPYGPSGRPSVGKVVLVEIREEGHAPAYTLKKWGSASTIKDGAGNVVEVAPNATIKAVAEMVAYMAVV